MSAANNAPVHQINLPLEPLIALLKNNGFSGIDTTVILNIQKVLGSIVQFEARDVSLLKSRLGPIICRNKEEQEKFNQLFSEYARQLSQFVENFEELAKDREAKRQAELGKQRWQIIRIWLIIIGVSILTVMIFVLLAVVYDFLFNRNPNFVDSAQSTPVLTISHHNLSNANTNEIALGDTVEFTLALSNSLIDQVYNVDWEVNDSLVSNTQSWKKIFTDTGFIVVKAHVRTKSGTIIYATLPDSSYVFCEHTPNLFLSKSEAGDNTIYETSITNRSKDSSRYQYKWYINDSLASTEKSFVTAFRSDMPYEVRVMVDLAGIHCSGNALTGSYKESAVIELQALGTSPLIMPGTADHSFAWLPSIIVFSFFAGMLMIYIKRKKTPANPDQQKSKESGKTQVQPGNYQAPYEIRFKTQEARIGRLAEVDQFIDGLRKRQLSESLRLDVKNTIRKTIRATGLPSLVFSPKTKPVKYLILIDIEHPTSHLVRMFQLLCSKLQKEDVEAVIYDYYKEPLTLNTQNPDHHFVTINLLAQRYPDSVLLIFTNGEYLFESLKPVLKTWVKEKFNNWKIKIMVTPNAVNDWGYKEVILEQTGFRVLPADFFREGITEIITNSLNSSNEGYQGNGLTWPASYSLNGYDFNNLDDLQKYTGQDSYLLQWICATAVYPHVDWEVTLAIGRDIEKEVQRTNQNYNLVTYHNLLKISRIPWMNDDIPSDTLRLDLLRKLSHENEAIARTTVIRLLDEIKETIHEESFAHEEFLMHDNVNRLLLAYYEGKNIDGATMIAVKEYYEKGYLDWALYNKLLEENGKLPGRINPYPIERYFKDFEEREKLKQDQTNNANRKRITRKRNVVAAAICSLLTVGSIWLLNRNDPNKPFTQPIFDLQFTLARTPTIPNVQSLSLIRSRDTNTAVKINDSVFTFKDLLIYDSSETVTLNVYLPALPSAINEWYAHKEITLNSRYYQLYLLTVPKTALQIKYGDRSEVGAIAVLAQKLGTRFHVDTVFTRSIDTTNIIAYSEKAADKIHYVTEAVSDLAPGKVVQWHIEKDPPKPYTNSLIELQWNEFSDKRLFSLQTTTPPDVSATIESNEKQITIKISGTVTGSGSSIQGARVDFLNSSGKSMGNSLTGPDGRFISKNRMTVRSTIKIKVTKRGYETSETYFKINSAGDAGKIMLYRISRS